MRPAKKLQAQDPLKEVDLGDGTIKRPTYISTKIDINQGSNRRTLEEVQKLFHLGLLKSKGY